MIAAKTLSLAAVVMTAAYVTSAHAEILIATAGPFTGQNIFRGEQIQHGAEMAVTDINATNGLAPVRNAAKWFTAEGTAASGA